MLSNPSLAASLPAGPEGLIAALPQSSRERRLEGDLAAARQVQRAFLPALEQQVRGVEIAAEYRPAYEVGGDFVEIMRRGRDERRETTARLQFVVGDVSGNGVNAALIMARVSGEVRRFAGSGRRPSRLLAGVNQWMNQQALTDRFVTATAIELDLDRGVWIAANAGHPAALLFRRDGRVQALAESGGPGLGLGGLAPWRCEDEITEALPDDLLLVFTDGLADRLSTTDLAELACDPANETGVARPSLSELRRRIFERVAAVAGPPDDATMLAVRLTEAAFARRDPQRAPRARR